MIYEILKISIPSLIVFLTAYYVLKTCLVKDNENKRIQIILQNQKIMTPLRLQAYERIILFLERISPNSIVLRLQTPDMTAHDLHKEILFIIRSEFEHNLSQQIYISSPGWEQVRRAKEKTIQLINFSMNGINNDEHALRYSQAIFENLMQVEKSPSQEAIDFLKDEIKDLYR